MKRKLRKILIWSLEGVAIVLALATGCLFFVHWKVSNGGMSLDILKPQITYALEKRLASGSDVTLDSLRLSREGAEQDGPLRLTIENLNVRDPLGEELIHLPSVAFQLSTGDLLKGKLEPKYVSVSDAEITVIRGQDGKFNLGFATQQNSSQAASFEKVFVEDKQQKQTERLFEGAKLTNTSLSFIDELTGQSWETSDVTADVERSDFGYTANFSAQFIINDQPSDLQVLAELDNVSEEITIQVETASTPVSPLVSLIIGPEAGAIVETNLSGILSFSIDLSGNLMRSRIELDASEGNFQFAEHEVPFKELSIRTDYFDSDRRFEIDKLQYSVGGNEGVINGVIALGRREVGQSLTPSEVTFLLNAKDIKVNFPSELDGVLAIEDIATTGRYLTADRKLDFSTLDADFFGNRLTGSFALLFSGEEGLSTGVQADVEVSGEVLWKDLLRAWPKSLADGARYWSSTNVLDGKISKLDFWMDMPVGAIQPATSIGDDAMLLSFDFNDVDSYYVPGVTPLTGFDGSAKVRGNSFFLSGKNGTVGKVRGVSGKVEMPAFFPKGSRGEFSVSVAGNVEDILSIIDEKPLGFISKGGFSPEDFGGTGQFDFSISRPLLSYVPIDDYDFYGKGTFENFSIQDVFTTYDLSDSHGTVEISWNGLDVRAGGVLEGMPVSFEYLREFTKTEDSVTKASGILTAQGAANLGFSVRQFLRGEIAYNLEVRENKEALQNILIQADLTNAEVRYDPVRYLKPLNRQTNVSVNLSPTDAGGWILNGLDAVSPAGRIRGTGSIDETFSAYEINLDEFKLKDRADLALVLAKDAGGLRAELIGDYANIDFLIDSLFDSGEEQEEANSSTQRLPSGIDILVDLKKMSLKNGVLLEDFKAKVKHSGLRFNNLYMSGNFPNNGYLAATLSEDTTMNVGRKFQAQTDNLGLLANGLFGITSIKTGRADYTATFLNNGPIAGTFTADSFTISEAPLIARLLAAGSLNGLSDLLSDEGIAFNRVLADVQYQNGVMSIVDARITGPALGVSIAGDIDLGKNKFDINGALAPAYQVNSVLGSLPGLGRLLVSRAGEGVVAFSYGVKGPIAEPTITVNTLSLLTPGIFRRIFEPVRARKKTTAELLDQAIAASEMSSQLEFATTAEQLQEYENTLDEIVPLLPEELFVGDIPNIENLSPTED